MLGHIDR